MSNFGVAAFVGCRIQNNVKNVFNSFVCVISFYTSFVYFTKKNSAQNL